MTPATRNLAPAGHEDGYASECTQLKGTAMRIFFAAAYLLAMVLHAEWTALSILLAVSLVALVAIPALRRRSWHLRVPVPVTATDDLAPRSALP